MKICAICKSEFETKTERKTCSKSCSSKLVRLVSQKTQNCLTCQQKFTGKTSNSKYCLETKTRNCTYCSQQYTYTCNSLPKQYCTESCKNSHTRRTKYTIKNELNCRICHQKFTPTNSRQKTCSKTHYKTCEYCSTQYSCKTSQQYLKTTNKYCDNICSTLAQTKSTLHPTLVKEYKNLNQWAKDFTNTHKRKPKYSDIKAYFQIDNIPKNRINKSLFNKKRGSWLEQTCIQYLELNYPELKYKHLHRQKLSKNYYEIDIYIPELHIGFEIQDYSTHSKTETKETNKYGGPMKTPKDHEKKRELYNKIGIIVIDIWEDRIRDNSFSQIIDKAIKGKNENL